MNRGSKTALGVLVLTLVALAAFMGGVLYDRAIPAGPLPGLEGVKPTVTRVVREAVAVLDREALEPSSEESMVAGAVKGLLESLDDPYAAYLDETHLRYMEEQSNGEFHGIGILVTIREGKAIVVSPMEGTPAEAAGMKAEDEIVSVEGFAPKEWTLDDIVARVRGPEGTEVTLEVRRAGASELLSFTVKRARIDLPNLESELVEGDIGYIRLMTFNNKAGDELRDNIESLVSQGAKGLILDLRDNPGGLLTASVEVSSVFVEDGVIVTVEDRNGKQEEHRATGGDATSLPMVVLINENSASASEIVAGALQDYGRATIVGAKSFGKGSVQTLHTLSNGGAIKFTVARYVTPKGRSIHKTGVEPDVAVDMDPGEQADVAKDTQRKAAIKALRDLLG